MTNKKLTALFSLLLCALIAVGCAAEKGSSVDLSVYLDPTATPLTDAQLDECTQWFAQVENNGLLRVPYTDAAAAPDQLVPYLEILLYDVGETDLSERELSLIESAGAYMDLVGKYRLSRTLIAQFLGDHFGISAQDAARILENPDPAPAGIYLDEYDAWYIVHGDTWFDEYTFTHGEIRADGTVRLLYVNPFLTVAGEDGAQFLRDQAMALTLAGNGGKWIVKSNEVLG
ncbi:MAG: hypothetical protein IKM11_04810 [Oscillospiraceae bacterium]|nr:hypothetical protein [Oscillospiraceae bacterium]